MKIIAPTVTQGGIDLCSVADVGIVSQIAEFLNKNPDVHIDSINAVRLIFCMQFYQYILVLIIVLICSDI